METPVLYLMFNRPDLVAQSFPKIKLMKPSRLFVASDGPRADIPDDQLKCKEARNIVIEGIDWDCNVSYLIRKKNLGCGKAVSEAISWFFSNVEEGIILEDDCLPDETFFPFCEKLLAKYRNNQKIYHIAGSNWQRGNRRGSADYYFSRIPGIWGWATWRDRWEEYRFDIFQNDGNMDLVKSRLPNITSSKAEVDFQINCFNACKDNMLDTWDYQWRFLVFLKNGLCIFPNKNLISNIGHREDGTHTTNQSHWRANLKTEAMDFPMGHPKRIVVNKKADKFLADNIFLVNKKSSGKKFVFLKKVRRKIISIIKNL